MTLGLKFLRKVINPLLNTGGTISQNLRRDIERQTKFVWKRKNLFHITSNGYLVKKPVKIETLYKRLRMRQISIRGPKIQNLTSWTNPRIKIFHSRALSSQKVPIKCRSGHAVGYTPPRTRQQNKAQHGIAWLGIVQLFTTPLDTAQNKINPLNVTQQYSTQHNSTQHNSTIQHNTTQHNTILSNNAA